MYILRGRAPRSGLGMVVVLLWLGVMTWQYPYGVAMFIWYWQLSPMALGFC